MGLAVRPVRSREAPAVRRPSLATSSIKNHGSVASSHLPRRLSVKAEGIVGLGLQQEARPNL